MTIQTKRLHIYPETDAQMEQTIAAQSDADLKEAFQQMLDGCRSHPTQREWYALWNLERNDESKAIVGHLSFLGAPSHGMVEIGYGIHAAYERQGYMTEAVSAAVRWAAAQEGVEQIEAETEKDNIASQRVLQKAGFVRSGEMGAEGPRFIWKG